MKILNIFPLTLAQDTIILDKIEKKKLIEEIKSMKGLNNTSKESNYAWTGDTKGHEFLFSNNLFKNLASKISQSIIKYLNLLEINTNLLDIYYQLLPSCTLKKTKVLKLEHIA